MGDDRAKEGGVFVSVALGESIGMKAKVAEDEVEVSFLFSFGGV